jgi:hypothetical protein
MARFDILAPLMRELEMVKKPLCGWIIILKNDAARNQN